MHGNSYIVVLKKNTYYLLRFFTDLEFKILGIISYLRPFCKKNSSLQWFYCEEKMYSFNVVNQVQKGKYKFVFLNLYRNIIKYYLFNF